MQTTAHPSKHSANMTRSQLRAEAINKKSHIRLQEEIQSTKRELFQELKKQYGDEFMKLKNASMGTLWTKFVRNRNDAEAFLEVMYPHMSKPYQLAYVDMFERAIRGEIELPKHYLRNDDFEVVGTWDPSSEINELKVQGQTNLAAKHLQELSMMEEEKKREK